MGFLNKLYENVRVNNTVVDHVNSNEIYNTTSQTIGSGTETVDAGTVTADDLIIGAANLAEQLFFQYPVWRLETTDDGGSTTLPGSSAGVHDLRLRQPGAGSSVQETRVYDQTTEFDPSVVDEIIIRVSNITIDNSSNARILASVTDDPTGTQGSGNDSMYTQIRGDGGVFALTRDDGTSGVTSDTGQNNAYVSGIETISLSWDGSTFTVVTDDGSTTVTVSDSSNYPSGENLFLKLAARDSDSGGAQNVDFDVGTIEVNP